MYTSREVRAGDVIPFCHALTEFPARIEAPRCARKSVVESRNSKFRYCRLSGLPSPNKPHSRSNSSLGTRQTAIEHLTGLDQLVPEATICMKKQGLNPKTPKLPRSYTTDYKDFARSPQMRGGEKGGK